MKSVRISGRVSPTTGVEVKAPERYVSDADGRDRELPWRIDFDSVGSPGGGADLSLSFDTLAEVQRLHDLLGTALALVEP